MRKSTLLGAVAGFTDITSGRIDLDGNCSAARTGPPPESVPERVVVFQDSTLFPWLTVADNIGYGLGRAAANRAAATRRVSRVGRLQEVGLGDIAGSYPGELSSGVQRRVEILRALVMEPAVLLLDEPFRGMDAISRSAMHDALLQIYDKAAVTVLFITHDIEEAVYLGSRVTVMTTRPGRVEDNHRHRPGSPQGPRHHHRTALPRTRRRGLGSGARRSPARLRRGGARDGAMTGYSGSWAPGFWLRRAEIWDSSGSETRRDRHSRLRRGLGARHPTQRVGRHPRPAGCSIAAAVSRRRRFLKLAGSLGYWNSWSLSFQRVLAGFAVALIVGGNGGAADGNPSVVQAHGVSGVRIAAADPAACLGADRDHLLADPELSITFVTFLGALFPVVLNTVGGAERD